MTLKKSSVYDITECKRVEEALKRSQRDYETLVNTIDGIVWEVDVKSFAFLFVSQKAERLLGYPQAEWFETPNAWFKHLHPEDRDKAINFCVSETKAKRDHAFEYRMIASDGRTVWLQDFVNVIVEKGEPVKLRGVMVDITGRRQAEDALRRNEADLQLALDAGRLGDWKWNIVTGEIVWSARCKALYGLPPDAELTCEHFLERVHPEDRDRIVAALKRAVETRTDYEVEKRVIWPDGSTHWNTSRGRVFCDDGGQPVRMAGVTMDITERKRAEEALQAAMARILQQESALITLTGKESVRSDKLLTSLHRISEVSARTLNVARVSVWRYNRQRTAIRCVDLYELKENRHSAGVELTVNDCPAYFQALAECDVIAADDAQNEPRTCEFSTGYLKPLGITSMMDAPIHLRGVLDGVVCHEHVGPLRKWTSDERTFVIAIANLVSLALEESERRQAEVQIKSSLKEKELLLKEVHHRVKNNLQVISSLLNWQSSYIEDTSARSIFKESQNRVRSMALIHEKLYQSEDLTRIDFGLYVQSLTASLFHSYGVDANCVKLEITVDGAFLNIDTAIPCGMILNELVSNALKHAFPDGRSGALKVALRASLPERLILEVSDNGIGLPAGLDIRTTRSLGFQLVITLTEQLKGNIEINRAGGVQFLIEFPALRSLRMETAS